MNSNLMSLLVNLPHKIQVPFQTLSDQEKSCLNFILRQNFENSWRVAQMRTVIEGQRDLAVRWIPAPEGCRVFLLDPSVKVKERLGDQRQDRTLVLREFEKARRVSSCLSSD